MINKILHCAVSVVADRRHGQTVRQRRPDLHTRRLIGFYGKLHARTFLSLHALRINKDLLGTGLMARYMENWKERFSLYYCRKLRTERTIETL